ncbi:MAG: hypothetical protein KTR16_03505, partial [Acidiferrobacterales bacterium]|nr:hypothetical protein [Acidiferrobacterales bacterium]
FGALTVVCAYLLVSKFSIPLALLAAWVGISLFTTSFFVYDGDETKLNGSAGSKKEKAVRRARNCQAKA